MELVLVALAIGALVVAFVLFRTGRNTRVEAGLPINARVIYTDADSWERVEKPLFSRRYHLTGKPDYLVSDPEHGILPIEVKPNRTDSQPRASDVMQLMAYAVLVEETYRQPVAMGLLKYRSRVFEIEFTHDLRDEFFDTLDAMRAARHAVNVHRSHDDPRRCQYCGYRDACEERLTPQ